ncbi:hypothetical protein IMCC1989_1759 [gamma proteobacterium IMCC1989]|nr:hypothetical protein IMCC1989_1759 [gamma proteobacterium IMCC1989]
MDLEINQLVSVLGKFSVGGSVSPYLLVGFSDVEIETNFPQTESFDGASFGVGIDFEVSENTSLALEAIQYADSDIATGGKGKVSAISM